MQCLFIKNLYNFYIDFEQFNEKAVGLFCWFANIQLAISRSAENLRRLMNDGEEGYLGQGSDPGMDTFRPTEPLSSRKDTLN